MLETYAIPGFAEPVSCWTHLLGAVVFLYLTLLLVHRSRVNRHHAIAMAVYGFCCVFLLSMSGVYHLLPKDGAASIVLQQLDHAAIYLMIAGTITAVHMVLFTGVSRWAVIALAWSFAAIAITFKTIYFADFPETLGLLSYLVFGWLGIFSGCALWREHGFRFITPLIYGGLAYTAGAVLEFFREPILIHGIVGPHEVFHVAVLLGISYHWYFIHNSLESPVR